MKGKEPNMVWKWIVRSRITPISAPITGEYRTMSEPYIYASGEADSRAAALEAARQNLATCRQVINVWKASLEASHEG